jgi:hypothetical protein
MAQLAIIASFAGSWQELDEFVATRELDQHFRKFFSW